MKKNAITAIFTLIVLSSSSFAISSGRLRHFSFATYAINHYQYDWAGSMLWGIPTADSLRDAVVANIDLKNAIHISSGGAPTSVSTYAFNDNDVTESSFLSSSAAYYNFVYYYGHGNTNLITMWNYNGYVYNNHPGIGVRNTYWVWLNSCLVFRNGYSDQEPWFDGMFKGAHSILGESSLSFGSYYTLKAAQDFASRWIFYDEKIWEAYYLSIFYYTHLQGGFDIEPKIVYRYGYINGVFFDPWEERFNQVYRGPIFYNNDYDGIGSRWITLGTPSYGSN